MSEQGVLGVVANNGAGELLGGLLFGTILNMVRQQSSTRRCKRRCIRHGDHNVAAGTASFAKRRDFSTRVHRIKQI